MCVVLRKRFVTEPENLFGNPGGDLVEVRQSGSQAVECLTLALPHLDWTLDPLLVSLDADTLVDADYLSSRSPREMYLRNSPQDNVRETDDAGTFSACGGRGSRSLHLWRG